MKGTQNIILVLTCFFCLLVFGGCKDNKTTNKDVIEDDIENTDSSGAWFPEEYYPHYETIYLSTGKGYEFKNHGSNKLLIIMSGEPNWQAKVGKVGNKLDGVKFIDKILTLYTDYDYSIFVPETFDWVEDEPGYYFYILKERERYTFDNIQACYVEVIREYLTMNNYETIIIAGYSAGAKHLPMVYNELGASGITALISIAGGGLSMYEDAYIMLSKLNAGEEPFDSWVGNQSYEAQIKSVIDYYREEPRNDSINRIGLGRSGVTYRWLNSIVDKRPFDYYEKITIPVLFIHGDRDLNVSVDSTKYIYDNLPDKPFDFIIFRGMGHAPGSLEQLNIFRSEIKEWLISKGF